MFSNIKHGWADFDFKGFKGVCSYIQDPVKDICKALTGTDESKIITVEMDEDGVSGDPIMIQMKFFPTLKIIFLMLSILNFFEIVILSYITGRKPNSNSLLAKTFFVVLMSAHIKKNC